MSGREEQRRRASAVDREVRTALARAGKCFCADGEHQQLEHSLATGFIKLQKERDPAQRQAQWVELQRLASEIERLDQ